MSVLPEPVGAATSVLRPDAIAGHACTCASVGPGKARWNHARDRGMEAREGQAADDIVSLSGGARAAA